MRFSLPKQKNPTKKSMDEPNVQRRACWLDTRLAQQPSHLTSSACSTSCICLLFPFILPKKPSKSTPAKDTAAAALSHRHHLIIHICAGPVMLANGLLSLFAKDVIPPRILHIFLSFFGGETSMQSLDKVGDANPISRFFSRACARHHPTRAARCPYTSPKRFDVQGVHQQCTS